MCRSVPQMAVFSTRISTSLGPGSGTGTCSIQMPLAASRLTSAFMVADIGGRRRGWASIIGCSRNGRGRGRAAGGATIPACYQVDQCMRTFQPSLSAAVRLAVLPTVHAGEGMWVPQQLPEIAGPLKEAGLRLDPAQLADLTGDPLGAVVSLGGCTA